MGKNGILLLMISLLFQACTERPGDKKVFSLLSAEDTGIDFANSIEENETANVLNYAYFYNGGGVAIGDINNDGLQDILFTGNMVKNRLYLNKGHFKFEDITEKSGIARYQGWCTGVSMADVNADGRLDIYICRSADADPARRKNLLFINNGDLTFSERAEEYGLADEGYSTQATWFDYDRDGDLDMFLVNHSLQQYATGDMEKTGMRNQQKPAFSNKLFRNDNGHFVNVTRETGISSNVLSFGLGVIVTDCNDDGWPDIYVSNDFNEPDYLFINRGGKFVEDLSGCMDQCSLFSMGCDAADVDNDGRVDLVTLDMLPEDNWSQKMHSGAENFDKFRMLFDQGIYYQASRNMLHHNNGDGTFSEVGQLAGISNTDWSWSALFTDIDNDGNKDLYITNGYAKDNTNLDFIKYHIDEMMKARKKGAAANISELISKMPSVQLPNYLYANKGNGTFKNMSAEWGLDQPSVSSGAAYADLDNDGAVDLVVNNINARAFVYRNNAHDLLPGKKFLKVKLSGAGKNVNGIGAKVKVYGGGKLFFQEQMPVRGFQSSVDQVLHFGLGKIPLIDSIVVRWIDGGVSRLGKINCNQTIDIKEDVHSLPGMRDHVPAQNRLFSKVKSLSFEHRENKFNDFTVQPLLPAYLSRPGPCLAEADVNRDGLPDVLIGGAKGQAAAIFFQNKMGGFTKSIQRDIASDSLAEDVSAVFFDADGDGDSDLYIASGGYEFAPGDTLLRDRLYINDGKGRFLRDRNKLPPLSFAKSCVRAADIDRDGDLDLFVGGRVLPGKYPLAPQSVILLNNGHGHFDSAPPLLPNEGQLGMVTDAQWLDLNHDQYPDLVVVSEWGPISILINDKGRLTDQTSGRIAFSSSGLWKCILGSDLDGDGNIDLLIGNQGLNNQFKASEKEPVTLCYKDFDGDGTPDPLMSYYIDHVSYPVYAKDDLMDQFPFMKKKYLEYSGYASATMKDLFPESALKASQTLKAVTLETIYLHNTGNGKFEKRPLPVEAQYSPVYAIAVNDINKDGKPDVLLGGNNEWSRVKLGINRACHGTLLSGVGNGQFEYVPQYLSGLDFRGDVRSMLMIPNSTGYQLLVGVNNDSLNCYRVNPQQAQAD